METCFIWAFLFVGIRAFYFFLVSCERWHFKQIYYIQNQHFMIWFNYLLPMYNIELLAVIFCETMYWYLYYIIFLCLIFMGTILILSFSLVSSHILIASVPPIFNYRAHQKKIASTHHFLLQQIAIFHL